MISNIFVNLAVQDISKTRVFWESLGFTINPDFSDEKALCLVMGENIYAMLLQTQYYKTFTGKEVANSHQTSEVILAVNLESKEKVDELVDKAVAAGAKEYTENPSDPDFMYTRKFEDLDGHQWEVFWMAQPEA